MKIKYLLLLLMPLLFIQCKTTGTKQIRKDIVKSYPIKRWLNQEYFEQSRALMFNSLPADIMQNDTIIILEYFTGGQSYSFSVYLSKDKSIQRGKTTIPPSPKHMKLSLETLDSTDKILEMVQRGDMDEVLERGDKSAFTPSTALVINIGVRDKDREKFDFTTFITKSFSTWLDFLRNTQNKEIKKTE